MTPTPTPQYEAGCIAIGEYPASAIRSNFLNPARKELFVSKAERQFGANNESGSRHPYDHVRRVCEGCFTEFDFYVEPGLKRLKPCAKCGKQTYWRVLVQPEGLQ